MAFFTEEKDTVALRLGLNIIAPKSALLTEEQQEAALGGVRTIRVQITADTGETLVDEEIPACKFSSGNVGYKLHIAGLSFQ